MNVCHLRVEVDYSLNESLFIHSMTLKKKHKHEPNQSLFIACQYLKWRDVIGPTRFLTSLKIWSAWSPRLPSFRFNCSRLGDTYATGSPLFLCCLDHVHWLEDASPNLSSWSESPFTLRFHSNVSMFYSTYNVALLFVFLYVCLVEQSVNFPNCICHFQTECLLHA
jgi:hypothetical protein